MDARAVGGGSSAGAGYNDIINGGFNVNQRGYVSGATVGAGLYGHDRWKMAASGDTYTFSTTANVTTITIPAGKVLRQVIEGINLQSGTYILTWTGTAQGKIGAGSLSASGVTGTATGGTDLTIEFGPGTLGAVKFEIGGVATVFRQAPYSVELERCQRYFEVLLGVLECPADASPTFVIDGRVQWQFKVRKRATPTFTNGAGGSLTSAVATVDNVAGTFGDINGAGGRGNIAANSTASAEL